MEFARETVGYLLRQSRSLVLVLAFVPAFALASQSLSCLQLENELGASTQQKINLDLREKDFQKLPQQVQKAFARWLREVQALGLYEVRKSRLGYHDEGLSGRLAGYRSVRLNSQYRAIYIERAGDILVTEITPHDYGSIQ